MSGEVATPSARAVDSAVEVPFHEVVCGVDRSRAAHEAARQAAALVAPGGVLELVAVADEWGVGLSAAAVLTRQHARQALDEIARELRGCGAEVRTQVAIGRPPHEVLMHAAAGRDLLVVGRAAHSRFGGIAIGSTASNLAHRARMPLLIATAPPAGVAFPERILVAADGPGHPERAVRAAGLIARSHGSDVTLVRLDWSHRAKGQELAAAVRELTAIGVEPLEIVMGGTPRRQIPALAADERASLVIVGCRGLSGARAIGSTSERVAHQAPCSVLILRPPVPVR